MSQSGITFLALQLLNQIPTLLVCLVAFVLALTLLGPGASRILTLLGATVIAVSMIGGAAATAYFIHSSQANGISVSSISWVMSLVNIVLTCTRAVGLSLLVAAIFAGRRRKTADLPSRPERWEEGPATDSTKVRNRPE